MQVVHLLDYLKYVVHRPRVPLPLTHTIVWGSTIYIVGPPAGNGTPQYFESSTFILTDTRPSGIWKRSEILLEDKPEPVED